jgi:hypothetical protein
MDGLIIEKDGVSYVRHSALFESVIKPAIMVPFNGVPLPVIARIPSYAEIRDCGEFSLIETMQDKINRKHKKITPGDMLNYADLQYKVVKKALVSPTYDEVVSICSDPDFVKKTEKEIEEIQDLIPKIETKAGRNKAQLQLDTITLQLKFMLPADFISTVFSFALEIGSTDILNVSEEMLYEAACLAKAWNGTPSDHLPGKFSKFNLFDINKRATLIFMDRNKKEG